MIHKQIDRIRQAHGAIIAYSNALIKDTVDADASEYHQYYSTFKREQLLNGTDLLAELVEREVQR